MRVLHSKLNRGRVANRLALLLLVSLLLVLAASVVHGVRSLPLS